MKFHRTAQLKSLSLIITAASILCLCTAPEKKEVPPLSKQDTAINLEDATKTARKKIADTLIKNVRSYEDTAKILTAGQFHEDEVWPGAEKENWLGLFGGEAGFSLAKTTLVISKIKDDLLDMEGDTTHTISVEACKKRIGIEDHGRTPNRWVLTETILLPPPSKA